MDGLEGFQVLDMVCLYIARRILFFVQRHRLRNHWGTCSSCIFSIVKL